SRGVKLILAACNAATSAALPELQEALAVPVVGVITPEAHAAVQTTRNRRIGLLATQATVDAGRYALLVGDLDAGAELVPVACPTMGARFLQLPIAEVERVSLDELRAAAA